MGSLRLPGGCSKALRFADDGRMIAVLEQRSLDCRLLGRDMPKNSHSFLTQKELDPDFIAFNANNRRYHFPRRAYLVFRAAFIQVDPQLFGRPSRRASLLLPYSYVQGRPTYAVDPYGFEEVFLPVNLLCKKQDIDENCCPENIDVQRIGLFKGEYDIYDFYPSLKALENGKNFVRTPENETGPIINEKRIGYQIQILSKTTGLGRLCNFTQVLTYTKNVVNGVVHPDQGKTIDDIALSGQDQSQPPFRQYFLGNPTFADPISAAFRPNSHYVWDYETCIHSGGRDMGKCKHKKCCIKWQFSARINADEILVEGPIIEKGKPKCE